MDDNTKNKKSTERQQYYKNLTEHRGPWEHSCQKPWFTQIEKTSGGISENVYINVESIDLSSFLKNNFTNEDHVILKLDVEGAEFDVIKSINFEKVFIDVIEFENNYDDTSKPIISYLESAGYIVIHKSLHSGIWTSTRWYRVIYSNGLCCKVIADYGDAHSFVMYLQKNPKQFIEMDDNNRVIWQLTPHQRNIKTVKKSIESASRALFGSPKPGRSTISEPSLIALNLVSTKTS